MPFYDGVLAGSLFGTAPDTVFPFVCVKSVMIPFYQRQKTRCEKEEVVFMWDSNDNYDVRDGARGVVRDTCRKGLILALENGQEAFAFFSGLRPGTEVFCTVLKPSNENLRMLVSVDAVLEEELAA
ncbi:hypothetical protein LKD27_04135 [Faecalibacterium sp. CLA-AA-H283]|jgi:hypothetical protein|uniref:hypothetical protein n=1 Tax=Faecalibacterium TaxID=216851 RepID=UPI00095FF500|nr:hypothetical protein [Faecalibacterium hominis (ex Afrizal et al. 2022)]MCC2138898.1 hypothetical protein [Faecalibacterium hominis (ex Afrizal et al. 2022)]OKZ68830.1 MAG: hypothetical protein BHV93_11765 [Clostridiales bacterium 52_15]